MTMTRFNIIAGTAIIPLLARLVLCAAFLTAGWNKLMHHQEFTGDDAQRLIDIGVVDIIREQRNARDASIAPSHRVTALAAAHLTHDEPIRQDPADDPLDDEVDDADDPDDPAQDDPAQDDPPAEGIIPEPPPDILVEDPVTGERTLYAKRLHGVTLILLHNNVSGPWAIRLAWLLAITELVAGALVLIGLFSRVWAVALATTMIVAFYLTSLDPLLQHGGPFGLAGDIAAFNRTYAQLGLLVLALAVALAGPGPVSIDRLIFRPTKTEPEDEYA